MMLITLYMCETHLVTIICWPRDSTTVFQYHIFPCSNSGFKPVFWIYPKHMNDVNHLVYDWNTSGDHSTLVLSLKHCAMVSYVSKQQNSRFQNFSQFSDSGDRSIWPSTAYELCQPWICVKHIWWPSYVGSELCSNIIYFHAAVPDISQLSESTHNKCGRNGMVMDPSGHPQQMNDRCQSPCKCVEQIWWTFYFGLVIQTYQKHPARLYWWDVKYHTAMPQLLGHFKLIRRGCKVYLKIY
jgi:hypothetical protein